MAKPAGYSRLQIRLHWLIAVLIVAQYVFKDYISDAWASFVETGASDFHPLIAAHVFGGILILLLLIWRLSVRFRRGVPATPEGGNPAMTGLAHLVQWSLYALMVILPVSGGLAWFGEIQLGAEIHNIAKVAMLALVALHVVGALFHQFVLKDNLIDLMKTPKD
jgi:cytochrome b561